LTFGCFNNISKIGSEVVSLWSQILRTLPQTRLVLKSKMLGQDIVAQRIRQAFMQQGVESERLILRGDSPHLEMLSQYADIDIALDPFPYTGGMTTLEALSQGVPVLTLRGDTLIARQSASIVGCVGLNEWIADSPQGYIDKAVRFAGQPGELAALRTTLRERVRQSPLGDVAGFTHALEQCYRTMWQRYCGKNGGGGSQF
jgi:predicted O-linked N-acetylglucosamine transferase (SPINDLY family)